MELDMKFEMRGEETVLIHKARMVGMYLPAGEGSAGPDTIHASLLPIGGGAAEVAAFNDEARARLWLIGRYVTEVALSGSGPLRVQVIVDLD